jgi:phosphoserine phosphatase RsbU/P
MKIVIAEDDPVAAAILDRTLGSFGHEVRVRHDGQAAWAAFAQEPAQLVISDWVMPRMDGMQLCEKIRQEAGNSYRCFILLTSRQTSGENYELAIAPGVDDFLTKPLDRQMIRMRVRVAERIVGSPTR